MIRVATVFSGIGSVEWALKKMKIEHKIVFACDNGEVEIFVENQENLLNKIKNMDTVHEKKEFVRNLYSDFSNKKNFVKESYLANYDIKEIDFLPDIRFIDGSDYHNQVDLLVGGSPCQSFSIMGYQKGFEDTRGTLFYDFARLVSEIQPKVFIFENVQGMIKHDKGNTWTVIKETFRNLGYDIHFDILDAKDYNIPQTRRRLFVVGFKNKVNAYEFPQKMSLDYTMHDFLESTVEFGGFNRRNEEITLIKHPGKIDQKYYLSEKVLNHVMSTGSKNYYVEPEIDLAIARPLLATMHKMHRAGVDNYVTLNNRVRRLTPRECLRLMGYDDSFKQVVSDTQLYRQAGNSIVVDVMMSILRSIIKSSSNLL